MGRSSASTSFSSLWARTASDVWVGGQTAAGATFLHWDGHTWTTVNPTPSQMYSASTPIWGAASNDVWALLYGGNYSNVYHWDGSSWKAQSAVVGASSAVFGFAANDVWTSSNYHWDGSSWSLSTNNAPCAGWLTGLSGSDLWASTNHWSGGACQPQALPMSGAAVVGAAVGANRVLLGTGSDSTGAGGRSSASRLEWERGYCHIPAVVDSIRIVGEFRDVWGSGPNDIYLEGRWGAKNVLPAGSYGGYWHWDGHAWTANAPTYAPLTT